MVVLYQSIRGCVAFYSRPLVHALVQEVGYQVSTSRAFVACAVQVGSTGVARGGGVFLFFFGGKYFLVYLHVFVQVSAIDCDDRSRRHDRRGCYRYNDYEFRSSIDPIPIVLGGFGFFLYYPNTSYLFDPNYFVRVPFFSRSNSRPVVPHPSLLLKFFQGFVP